MGENACDAVFDWAARDPGRATFAVQAGSTWRPVTAGQFAGRVASVVGDRRPYVAALVTLDDTAFARWKRRQGKPAGATVAGLRDDPELRAVVQQAVDRANTAVSRAEGIKRFRILPGRFEVGTELTPTQKIRRDYVLATYASDIDALYA